MQINGRISLLINQDGLRFELHDDDSQITFARGSLNAEQTCQALSRLAMCPCEVVEVFNLENVGKNVERKEFMVRMGKIECYSDRKALATKKAQAQCPEGWKNRGYFDSQDSFFKDEEGNWFARDVIYRYVPKEEEGD